MCVFWLLLQMYISFGPVPWLVKPSDYIWIFSGGIQFYVLIKKFTKSAENVRLWTLIAVVNGIISVPFEIIVIPRRVTDYAGHLSCQFPWFIIIRVYV